MNILFVLLFFICAFLLFVRSPDAFLPALLEGASNSAVLCFSLIATYAVWLGLMKIWEDCGVAKALSKLVKPVAKRLFKTEDEEALQAVCMNLSVNLLGISGAATPYGIKAAKLLDKTENAEYASAVFFVLNATSLQLLPTSIIGVRTALGSSAPTDIVLPTILVTIFSTLVGVLLIKLFVPSKKSKKPTPFLSDKQQKIQVTQGAGI